MAEHNLIGRRGEDLAVAFLEGKHFLVLERNWRAGKHEVDLIAQHGRDLVIVEVKTRSSDQHGLPEDSVKKGKRGKLIKAANAYAMSRNLALNIRFDIVSVILHPSGKPYIHHIQDAFYPTKHDRPY